MTTQTKTQQLMDEIKARGLLHQTTDHANVIEIKKIYCGFDATALSLQVGNLLTLSYLRLVDKHNIGTIAILGGATTRVGGDPSQKTETRKKLENAQILDNLSIIEKQIKSLVPNAKVLNNAQWLDKLQFVDFLETIACYVPVGALIKLETFANRLKNNEPFNMQELLYPLMQGYDFLWLYENEGCNAELGGSDQWCNILPGIDLIKKKHENAQVIGLTIPLLTKPDGTKMGKSVSGAIYLNPNMCSSYDFWQFWRNIDDSMVHSCMKKFTLMDTNEIDAITDINQAKIILANDVTTWVHGSQAASDAQAHAKTVFVERNLKAVQAQKVSGNKLVEIMVELGAAETNSQAKTLIEQSAVKVNDEVINDKGYLFSTGIATLSVGKKKFYKIRVE